MSRHSGGGKPVQFQSPSIFDPQQQPLQPPQHLFLVENFNQEPPRQHFSTDSFSRNHLLQNGKRKSSNSQSLHTPRVKQHITEERIASSMQMLSLDNDPPLNRLPNQNATNRVFDEGFVDSNEISSDEDIDEGIDFSSETFWKNTTSSTTSSIKINFAPGVKESLVKLDEQSFIPKKIIDDIHRNSLALIPYKPSLLQLAQNGNTDESAELVFNKNSTSSESFNVKGEMDVDGDNNEDK